CNGLNALCLSSSSTVLSSVCPACSARYNESEGCVHVLNAEVCCNVLVNDLLPLFLILCFLTILECFEELRALASNHDKVSLYRASLCILDSCGS
ncbi:hypothetical protein COCCADRAFT_113348, partial [Bipolaris zeicola 26-R-13]